LNGTEKVLKGAITVTPHSDHAKS